MLGIIIGLALLMILAYRGYSIVWVAPLTALVVAATGGLELLPAYTETYMTGFVNFTKSWFPVFMLGAIFGKLMEMTGSARSVAMLLTKIIGKEKAILAIVVGCAVLTYGGISLFVVVFAMYPLSVALFREANLPRRLIPGSIALGAFTFTMTAIPGTPQIQNLIPMDYYKTTPLAAPIMGIAAALVMFFGGYFYLIWKEKRLLAAGEHFEEPKKASKIEYTDLPNPILSILPLAAVVLTLNFLNWPVILALLSGIFLTLIFNCAKWKNFTKTISDGAESSVLAIINTSAAVGFGSVVSAVPGFHILTNLLLCIKGSPLISEGIAVTLLAGATGSASGGMGIALSALGPKYMELAMELGIDPSAFHRIASLASGGLDTLPHNGAVLTLLAVTGMTHKESYIDIFVVCCVIPLLSTVVAIIFAMVGLI